MVQRPSTSWKWHNKLRHLEVPGSNFRSFSDTCFKHFEQQESRVCQLSWCEVTRYNGLTSRNEIQNSTSRNLLFNQCAFLLSNNHDTVQTSLKNQTYLPLKTLIKSCHTRKLLFMPNFNNIISHFPASWTFSTSETDCARWFYCNMFFKIIIIIYDIRNGRCMRYQCFSTLKVP